MAERGRFELPVPVKVRLISSQVHSTGLCHLSVSPVYREIADPSAPLAESRSRSFVVPL